MLMSALLVYATRRTANCVALAILIGSYQLVNDIRAHGGNASIFAALHSRAPGHSSTQAQSAIQFWLDCESSYKRLSLLALDLVAVVSRVSQAYVERLFSLCSDLTARKRNSTKVSLCRRVFLKLNCHILHWTQCTVNWSVTCFCHCRTADDTLQRLCFWLLMTYLLSVVISRTTLTYKNVKSKTKMLPKRKRKCQCKTKANLILKTKKILQQ